MLLVESRFQDLRCPIMSEKKIICLRYSSLWNTFEVERKEARLQ